VIKQQRGKGNWGMRSVIMYTEKICNLQAKVATVRLTINSKETKELHKKSNITIHINLNKVLIENLHIWVTL
jgi:hypothetical protein